MNVPNQAPLSSGELGHPADKVVTTLKSMKYNKKSGNLFDEQIVRAFVAPDWYRKTRRKLPSKNPKDLEINGSMLSLFDIARSCLVENAQDLELESLKDLDWRYGRIIWDDICDAGKDSFHLFTLFGTTYRTEKDFIPIKKDYLVDCPVSPAVLRICEHFIHLREDQLYQGATLSCLSSEHWLVLLSFGGESVQFTRSDLLALADLPNLAALDLSRPHDNHATDAFDGIVLRQWARKVQDQTPPKCFSKLKYLDLRGRDDKFFSQNPDFQIHLAGLPALKFVNLSRRDSLDNSIRKSLNNGQWILHIMPALIRHIIIPATQPRGAKLTLRLQYLRFADSDIHDLKLAYSSLIVEHLKEDVAALTVDMHLQSWGLIKYVQAPPRRRKNDAGSDIIFLERIHAASASEAQNDNSIPRSGKKRSLSVQSVQQVCAPAPRKLKKGKAVDLGDMLGSFSTHSR